MVDNGGRLDEACVGDLSYLAQRQRTPSMSFREYLRAVGGHRGMTWPSTDGRRSTHNDITVRILKEFPERWPRELDKTHPAPREACAKAQTTSP